jgi:SRSO17 transposase
MGKGLGARFDRYCEVMVEALAHADREGPARWYLQGLMLPGGRKSVEPMAARVHPQNVGSAHQSMHHLVADAEWSNEALLRTVAARVLPVLTGHGKQPCVWIIDDTGVAKKGRHSVGVARQYCGRLGKTENCQVAVSLSLATAQGSLPLAHRLYLPQEWTDDRARCQRAGVPDDIGFSTKGEIAWAQIEAALRAGVARGPLLADAGYGDEAGLRDRLTAQGIPYALGVRSGTAVWWGPHQPVPLVTRSTGRGRARTRVQRDDTHQPISVLALAKNLPASSFRSVSWRQGSAGVLRSRFACVRVQAAHADRPRATEWLVIEWPLHEEQPIHYWLSTLPEQLSSKQLVSTIKARWMIERDYLELKQELGLGHYEGRNWRGIHHHATLCIAAYGFLMLERLSGVKKNSARLQTPALPEGFRPRGARPDAASHPLVDRHRTLSPGKSHRTRASAMPLLRPATVES